MRGRLIALSTLTVVGVFGLVLFLAFRLIASLQDESLDRFVRGESSKEANAIAGLLDRKIGYVRAAARSVEALAVLPDAQKFAALDSITRQLAYEDGVSSCYMSFEPGMYFDASFVRPGAYPGMGYYVLADGVPRQDGAAYAADMDSTMDWYWLPFRREKETIIEPYNWAYEGAPDSILMVSIGVPIRVKNRVVGVLGMDIPLATIQKILADVHPVPESYAILVSASGARVAHPKTELLGKVIGDDLPDSGRTLLDSIAQGSGITVEKRAQATGLISWLRFSPVKIGATGQAWSLAIVFPVDRMRAPSLRIRRVILVVAGAGVLLLLGLLAWLSSRTLNPLREVTGLMREMADGDGDLTRRMRPTGLEETDRMGEEFNRFAEVTRTMIASVVKQTHPLEQAGRSMLAVSAALDDRSGLLAEEAGNVCAQAQRMGESSERAFGAMERSGSQLEMLAAAVEEMNASVQEIARGAEVSRATAREAMAAAEQAGSYVGELATASREIEQVIEIIVEISEQTKLLALNATIEAARAGEAGRGFAVVASEVKDLAKGTADATEEIRSRVARIRAVTGSTVDRIGVIREVIRRSTDMQNGIAASVEEQSATTREIASGLGTVVGDVRTVRADLGVVAEGARSVNQEMVQLSSVSADLLGEAQSVREQSERMVQVASEVQGLLGRFKV